MKRIDGATLLLFACCIGCTDASDQEETGGTGGADSAVEPLGCESEWEQCSPDTGCGEHTVCVSYGDLRVQQTASTAAASVSNDDAMAPDATAEGGAPPNCQPGSFAGQLFPADQSRYPLIGPPFEISGELEFDIEQSGADGWMVANATLRVLETNLCAYETALELYDSNVTCGSDGVMVHLAFRAPGGPRPAMSLMAHGDGELIGEFTYETWCVQSGEG